MDLQHTARFGAPYRALLLDWGEVLYTGLWVAHNIICILLGCSREECAKAFHNNGLLEYFRGAISEEELLRRVIHALNATVNAAELAHGIRSTIRPIEASLTILGELKALGYQLYLVSDHGKEWAEYCHDTHGHHLHFDRCFYSFDLKCVKEEERFFKQVLAEISVKPEECLLVDDRPINIIAATKLGIQAHLFTDPGTWRVDLYRRCILPPVPSRFAL